MAQDTTARNRLQRVLKDWRDGLLDLSGRNRLLNFKHSRAATLDIRTPSAQALLEWPAQGWRFAQLPEDDETEAEFEPEPGTIVTQKELQSTLDAALRKLFRDSGQVFNDTGLWVLQLGAGFLHWRETEKDPLSAAPLLLVPVRLQRLGPAEFKLLPQDGEDAVPNPALAVKMASLDIDWPSNDAMKDLAGTLRAVRKAVEDQRGWSVDDKVVLAMFHSHKEAMYRDLLDNEQRILDHPLVQAIGLRAEAGLPEGAFSFEPADLARIDELQPPEDTPLVLDADSSQRQCVAAALAGHSFVMDGPPGTGKSQTIANMIAALMHAGKTVLFVSEKAAALDVVRNRLEGVGLGSFLLSLHSHHASRKQVAAELGSALNQQARAQRKSTAEERARLRELRERLSSYAAAMNEERRPLGRSLHDVIGRVKELQGVPHIPVAVGGALSAGDLHALQTAARKLELAWRPVAEGAGFPWRGLSPQAAPLPALRRLADARTALQRHLERYEELSAPLGIGVDRLIELLDLSGERPEVPAGWFDIGLDELRGRLDEFSSRVRILWAEAERLHTEVGPDWNRLPEQLPAVRLPVDELGLDALSADRIQRLRQEFHSDAALLRQALRTLTDLASVFQLPAPETLVQAFALCELAELSAAEPRPEAAWLSAEGGAAAETALRELQQLHNALAAARGTASDLFSDAVTRETALSGLAHRFTHEHRKILNVSKAYREDKKALAALTVDGKWQKSAAERVGQALAWQEAHRNHEQAVQRLAPILSRYWQGERTDYELIASVLLRARRIRELAAGADPRSIAALFSAGTPVQNSFSGPAEQAKRALLDWQGRVGRSPRLPALDHRPLEQAAAWYENLLPNLDSVQAYCRTVQDDCQISGEPTFAQCREIARQVFGYRDALSGFLTAEGAHQALLGSLYAVLATDLGTLDRVYAWVSKVQGIVGHVPSEAVPALLSASPDPGLTLLDAECRDTLSAFTGLFEPRRGGELHAALTGADASLVLKGLLNDPQGPDEWLSYREGLSVLEQHGLADLVAKAASRSVDGGSFGSVVERSVLEAWIEHQLTGDPRLTPGRGVERDELVAEFKRLDDQLVRTSYAQVIEACNARRPNPALGQTTVIQAEANKKARHMPVRLLLEKTQKVVPLLKPCFMMSPLTVSQFLPAGYEFDVVIFDEASQVRPEDAVNCVYRGRALIVAGDQKQLPPTDFFSQREEISDEYDEDGPESFDSLLDMCKASGLVRHLSLRWHYRSRHEDLIAFSNRRFYGSELITFPGAQREGADVGVAFFKADGVYDRGRTQRNPIEAQEVARRVFHHYTTRPGLSLGVVAMSAAQAEAIEDAVDQARKERPDLDRHFTGDRLDGFFVKNLETVQGDERDVILLSVGYGPDKEGKITMAFGPLNQKNGWRRLNVAVTRARHRIEVVSSVTGGDIQESANVNRNHFKRYLDYAERGPSVLEQRSLDPSAEPESPFEESVLDVLTGWGYEVQPQVGVGSYRIDMAVQHPSQPGRFVLGIECDGAMYHSSRAARDRDRLREGILRGLGWKLHRIWGTDWYRDQENTMRRLREAIDTAIAAHDEAPPAVPAARALPEPSAGELSANTPAAVVPVAEPEPEPQPVVEFHPVEHRPERPWARAYQHVELPRVTDLFDMHLPEAKPILLRQLEQIIDVEAPIHRGALHRKVARAWLIDSVKSKTRGTLDQLLRELARAGKILIYGDFIYRTGAPDVARSSPIGSPDRKIAEIPSTELRRALLGFIEEAPGAKAEDLTTAACRFFGWQRRGPEIKRSLDNALKNLFLEKAITGYPDRIEASDTSAA